MLKAALIAICLPAFAGPISDDNHQFEIRKYRFGRHANKGFERLVIEFDHLGGTTQKPLVKVEMDKHDASITVSSSRLSGIIPESEINHSYLNRSRFLGPISISAKKESFNVAASFKRNSTVEAFWLDNPARLVVDVFSGRMADRGNHRKLASERHKQGGEVLCFPVNSQLQASVAFGRKTPPFYGLDGNGGEEAVENDVVCFPKGARLTPQIFFKNSPFPNALGTIQTDPVGGSYKTGPAAQAPHGTPSLAAVPPIEPMMISPNQIATVPETVAAVPQSGRTPTSASPPLSPSQPGIFQIEPPAVQVQDPSLPATPSEVTATPPSQETANAAAEVSAEAPAPELAGPFPVKKKKKKKKPRLPQLPPSITEGALLPPIK